MRITYTAYIVDILFAASNKMLSAEAIQDNCPVQGYWTMPLSYLEIQHYITVFANPIIDLTRDQKLTVLEGQELLVFHPPGTCASGMKAVWPIGSVYSAGEKKTRVGFGVEGQS